jgi:predicted nucleotidyltransferase
MFRDLDHIKTFDDLFFVVRGDHHPRDKVRAVPIYFPKENGDRFDIKTGKRFIRKIEEYSKDLILKLHSEYLPRSDELNKYGVLVPVSHIVNHYLPRVKTKECLENKYFRETKWGKFILSLNKILGISIKDIGIYGSTLIGLKKDLSDVDLVIYGKENLLKLKKNFDLILRKNELKKISKKQLYYFIKHKKLDQYYPFSTEQILKIFQRRWSGIYINGDIMFIRFVYKENEIPENLYYLTPPIDTMKVKGRVIDSLGSHFIPRVIKVKVGEKLFEVVSYYWIFFSCVLDGEEVEIFGNYRRNNKREFITLDEPEHYILPIH